MQPAPITRLCAVCVLGIDVNDACLKAMPTPPAFVEGLPKKAKDLIDAGTRRALKDGAPPAEVIREIEDSGTDLSDTHTLLRTLNQLEQVEQLWHRKAASSTWPAVPGLFRFAGADDERGVRKQQRSAEAARATGRLVDALKVGAPGLAQTELEKAKISQNRDVGLAGLEALSRVLESRAHALLGMVADLLVVAVLLPPRRVAGASPDLSVLEAGGATARALINALAAPTIHAPSLRRR